MTIEQERINHQAYEDVLDAKAPQSQDAEYLACYHGWANVAGPSHFDPHEEYDFE